MEFKAIREKIWKAAGILLLMLLLGGCGETIAPASAGTVMEDAETDTDEQALSDTKVVLAEEVTGELTVTFLDVGQGNATLIANDGKYMLIDGGDREYSSFVVSYLKNAGVEELEYVIASHYDADHLNGVVGVLHAFPCKTVLAADYVTDTRVYDSFGEVVTEQDIKLVYPSVGDVYSFGDAEFTVVCPDNYEYADVNDNSVGVRLVHGENSFLICGDAGEKSEAAMLGGGMLLDSDVYLASHHGSDGSSSMEFLWAVMPEAVVFSVGADNSYGHPSERVLGDVTEIGADIYRTDLQGTIRVTSDGQSLSWSVEPVGNLSAATGAQSEENAAAESPNAASDAQSAENDGAESPNAASDTQNAENDAPAGVDEVQETYILNRNTKKFHLPSCSSAADIKSENRAEFYGTREELLEAGYDACKRCNP